MRLFSAAEEPMVRMTLSWMGLDSNFQYAGAVNLAAISAPRPTPPLRNRKFARVSAGERWIRTSSTRARSARSRALRRPARGWYGLGLGFRDSLSSGFTVANRRARSVMAVAGFSPTELDVTVNENTFLVTGEATA